MTVKDLRTLIDNLEEYIHVPGGIDRLRKTVLHLAVSGQLMSQDPSEGTGDDLYQKIQNEKQKLIREGEIKKQRVLPEITEEVPFNIPGSWKWARLGSITQKIGSGSTPRGGKSVYISEGPVFLRSQNVWNDGLHLKKVAHISNKTYEKMSNTYVLANDVLLNITGASIGRSSVVPDTLGKANVSQHVSIVRPFFHQQSRYINLVFISGYFQNLIDEIQVGVSREGLSKQNMEKMLIPLPPLSEQERISEKVSSIFALINELAIKYSEEQTEREKLVNSSLASLPHGKGEFALSHLTDIIRTADDASRLRKAILQLAVSGRLVPQIQKEGTGEDLYQQIQAYKQKLVMSGELKKQRSLPKISESEIAFQIPKTWKWVRLADATIFSIGRTPARKEHTYWDENYMPWVSIADLRAGKHISETKEKISSKAFEKCFGGIAVPAGSLLYSFKLTIGKMSIIDMDAVHNEAIASFTTHTPEFTEYLFKALEAIDPLSRTNQAIKGKTLNSASLSLLEIPLPPAPEQARIIAKTNQLLDLVGRFETALKSSPSIPLAESVEQSRQFATKQLRAVNISDETPQLTNQQKKVQRKMLACFIANESIDGKQFGKTKFEKLLHLIEYHVLKKDLNQKYSVQPAGPYDGAFTKLFWDDVTKSKWYKFEGYGNLQKIVAGDNHIKAQKDYGYLSDNEKAKVKDLLTSFKNWGYGEAEIISTLYAAWNNRIIKGEEITDDLLKQDFLQWDPQKTQYSSRLDQALSWMRSNNLVPDGWGKEINRAKSRTKSGN
jgi:type I restriction enzyme, S subunit